MHQICKNSITKQYKFKENLFMTCDPPIFDVLSRCTLQAKVLFSEGCIIYKTTVRPAPASRKLVLEQKYLLLEDGDGN